MATATDERFAVLTQATRVWAVGAIQGEAERLQALHAELESRFAPGDRLVYLGNYLGQSAAVHATLDALLDFRRRLLTRPGLETGDIVFVRGAQEEMWHKLLQIQFATDPRQVFEWMLEQGVGAALEAYGGNAESAYQTFRDGVVATTRWTSELRAAMQRHPGHEEILTALKRAAYTEGGELLLVHAGVDPSRPVSEQGDALWWGSGYFATITEPYQGFRRVIRGFARSQQADLESPFTATLDGGAGFGGSLIAACFDLDGRHSDVIEI